MMVPIVAKPWMVQPAALAASRSAVARNGSVRAIQSIAFLRKACPHEQRIAAAISSAPESKSDD